MRLWDLPRTEQDEILFFQEWNILPKKRKCGNSHEMKLYFGKRNLWRCNLKECAQRVGLRKDNWFIHKQLGECGGSANWRNKRHRGTARHHLESYLSEFIWRQHQLKENRDCFESMLNSIGPFSTEIRLTTLFLNNVLLLGAYDKIAPCWRFCQQHPQRNPLPSFMIASQF